MSPWLMMMTHNSHKVVLVCVALGLVNATATLHGQERAIWRFFFLLPLPIEQILALMPLLGQTKQ
jgi:hypothetical protein